MEVALPSGGVAVFRDSMLRGDRRTARKAMVFVISPDGSRRSDGSLIDNVTDAVIRRMLVSWPFGPVPGDAQSDDLALQMLDRLDDDDYEVLEKAVGPWVERVMRTGRNAAFTHVPTGVLVEPVNPAEAARLAAHADFLKVDDGSDPKQGGSGSTATSSSDVPALTGPTQNSTP